MQKGDGQYTFNRSQIVLTNWFY